MIKHRKFLYFGHEARGYRERIRENDRRRSGMEINDSQPPGRRRYIVEDFGAAETNFAKTTVHALVILMRHVVCYRYLRVHVCVITTLQASFEIQYSMRLQVVRQQQHCGKAGNDFIITMQNGFKHKHENFHTRSNNLLDLMFSSELNMMQNINRLEKHGSRNHAMIEFQLHSK